jgi:hypothetical protein
MSRITHSASGRRLFVKAHEFQRPPCFGATFDQMTHFRKYDKSLSTLRRQVIGKRLSPKPRIFFAGYLITLARTLKRVRADCGCTRQKPLGSSYSVTQIVRLQIEEHHPF